jgi:hypothetical protein
LDWVFNSYTNRQFCPHESFSPVVYITRQAVRRPWSKVLTVLPQQRYKILANFTQAQITAPKCMRVVPSNANAFVLKIEEHSENGTQTCLLPIIFGPNYLTAVKRLPNMNWSDDELRPINQFASVVQYISAQYWNNSK